MAVASGTRQKGRAGEGGGGRKVKTTLVSVPEPPASIALKCAQAAHASLHFPRTPFAKGMTTRTGRSPPHQMPGNPNPRCIGAHVLLH